MDADIRFNKVRVPRAHMLNRFAQVSKEGAYTKPPHDKLSYGGMIFIRANMVRLLPCLSFMSPS